MAGHTQGGKRLTPWRALAGSVILSALVAGGALAFANPPQCPDDITPAQLERTNCVIGANIGLGLLMLLACAILAGGLVVAAALWFAGRELPPPQPS